MALWRTNVGSHMWGMEHAGSDLDVFEVFQSSSGDILVGQDASSSYHNQYGPEIMVVPDWCYTYLALGKTVDVAGHEIGKVVNMVLNGNVNFLWGVFSPIVLYDGDGLLRDFRAVAKRNMSRRCYHSIRGLATHNWKKYIETGKDVSTKRLNIIGRTIQMGIGLLETGEFAFQKTSLSGAQELRQMLDALDVAYRDSILPDAPQAADIMREWLLALRLQNLED